MCADTLYRISSKSVKKYTYGDQRRSYLRPSVFVIETAVTKLTLARQLLAKNSYIEFHENLAHCLVRYQVTYGRTVCLWRSQTLTTHNGDMHSLICSSQPSLKHIWGIKAFQIALQLTASRPGHRLNLRVCGCASFPARKYR